MGQNCVVKAENEKYSGAAAVQYAKAYCSEYNESFPSFAADCTNFVSQCVGAGGIKEVTLPEKKVGLLEYGRTYMCKDYWSCRYYTNKVLGVTIRKGYVPTSTWTVVDQPDDASSYGFQDFMKKNKEKGVVTYTCNKDKNIESLIKKAKVGDIVQYKSEGKNRYTHSYIVGKKQKNPKQKNKTDLYFYAHSGSSGGRDASDDDTLRYLLKNDTIRREASLALISMQ